MKITGGKRWFVVALCALMAGIMVYVPFLRYSFYDQMCVLFTEYKQVVSPDTVNSFIGDFGMAFGIVSMLGYPFGGIFADRFNEKWLLIAGGVLMGICSFWLGIVPDKTSIIIIHLLYGVGTSFMIWSAYLKLTRKMGNEKEQGRMFSTSEFVRGIFGMLIGFAGVALLGQATLGSGELDPAALGVQWRNLMWISGALFLIFALLVLLFIPAKVTGAEETGSEVQEAFSLKNVVKVLKMPGTWLISALVFCCFSFTSAGNGYLGPYTVNVLGVSETMASSFAIVRNYIIAAVMTLAIGFISDKIGSKAKTLGIYLAIASVLGAALVFTKSAFALCLVISFVFAIVYSGMRGIYFATLNEVGIPLSMTGIATGIISMLCYLPDVYFAKLAGTWLDHYGNAGYDMIWYWASFSGAGNFIGQAGRGAMEGISAYWLWLGEGFLGGIIMGYILAPYLARFKYLSMPHFISGYLFGGDPQIRRVGGIAALMPNVVWPGAQIMGVAYVLELVFGIDYRIAVIVCGVIFVFYTVSGGLKAVVYADAFHGTIQLIFAVVIIVFGLRLFHFDFGYLKEQVMAVDPGKWDLFVEKPAAIVTSFLTGLVGAVSNPIFWNRAFAAKDVKTARKAYGLTFFMNIIMVFIMILLGIVSLMYTNQGDQSLVWLIMNKMPVFCSVILAVSVLAACMSCADTHLNCAAANIVSDIMDPQAKLGDETSVRYAKRATLAAGVVAILAGFFGDYIYALGTYGYTVCGGVLIPAFLVGLICRDRKSKEFRSKMSVTAAQIGMIIGVAVAILFELVPSLSALLGGGVLPAIGATVGGMVIANLFCKDQTWKKTETTAY